MWKLANKAAAVPASVLFGAGLFWDQVSRLRYLLPSERFHALVNDFRVLRKVADRSTANTWLDSTQSEGYALEKSEGSV